MSTLEARHFPVDRIVFTTLVVLVTVVGEEFAGDGRPSFWFGHSIFGVPLVYPAVVGVLALAALYLQRPRAFPMVPRLKAIGMWRWIVGGWIALAVAIGMAIGTGATELFADWRNFVLMVLVVLVLAPWLSTRTWRAGLGGDLVIGYGVFGLVVLIRWMLGEGSTVVDQRITVFYWPHLLALTYASVVGAMITIAALHDSDPARTGSRFSRWSLRTWLLLGSTVVSTVVILLSFRRSFWLAWGAGMLAVLVVSWQRRQLTNRTAMIVGVTVAIGFVVLFVTMGTEAVTERFASFLPSSSNEYAATNEDHVNDLREAFRTISREPLLGLGIGRTYATPSLSDWKETSFEVHNAVLHAWLKFGLLGLVVFIGFHYGWIREMLRTTGNNLHDATRAGIAAYIVAQLANTTAQTWVYGRVQVAIQMGVLLALMVADAPPRQTAPLSEPDRQVPVALR